MALAWLATAIPGSQVRDGSRTAPPGSATLVGQVVSDETQPRPLRHARVSLSGDALPSPLVAITDDQGRFRMDGAPTGHFSLSAAKPGYVTMHAGATRPLRSGPGIDLRAGQTAEVVLRLPHGGVIAGTVTNPAGTPLQNIQVFVLRQQFDPTTGRRPAVPTGDTFLPTNDLGEYRVFGLPAGDYLVQVGAFPRPPGDDPQLVSPPEVRAALASLGGGLTQARPGMPPPQPPLPPQARERQPVSLAPVYYPGTPFVENATAVSVGAGEERLGIDIALSYTAKATVSGSVALPPDRTPPTVTLARDPSAGFALPDSAQTVPASSDGTFRFPAVAPGRYTLSARAAGSPRNPATAWSWTTLNVVVSGDDLDGLALSFQQPLTVSGRVAFDRLSGSQPAGRLPLPLSSGPREDFRPPAVIDVQPDGRFTLTGLSAGPVRWLGTAGLRSPANGWWLTSISTADRNLLEAPLTLTGDLADVEVRLTSDPSTVAGRVESPDGRPASGLHVVFFPPEPAGWFFPAPRIARARTASDGRFTIRNLPAGEYRVALSDDLEVNEWYDSAVLTRLASTAGSVRVNRDRTTVNLVWQPPGTVAK